MAYRDIDWTGLEDDSSITDDANTFNLGFAPINWVLNTIAFVLKIIITTITDFSDIIKLTFSLLGSLLQSFGKIWYLEISKIMLCGIFFVILSESIDQQTLTILYTIVCGFYFIKVFFYNIPVILWDEAIKSRITNKRYVITISTIIIGGIITSPITVGMLGVEEGQMIAIGIIVVYGSYLAIADKILERM